MPAIKREDKKLSPEFVALEQFRTTTGENNDCAIKVITLLTGQPYNSVLRAANERGRVPGNGTPWNIIMDLFDLYGYSVKLVEDDEMLPRKPDGTLICTTITTHHPKRFNKLWANGANYMLLTCRKRHVAAVMDGTLHDWTVGSSKRVNGVYQIIQKP